jgi:hypothetical protein
MTGIPITTKPAMPLTQAAAAGAELRAGSLVVTGRDAGS